MRCGRWSYARLQAQADFTAHGAGYTVEPGLPDSKPRQRVCVGTPLPQVRTTRTVSVVQSRNGETITGRYPRRVHRHDTVRQLLISVLLDEPSGLRSKRPRRIGEEGVLYLHLLDIGTACPFVGRSAPAFHRARVPDKLRLFFVISHRRHCNTLPQACKSWRTEKITLLHSHARCVR